MVPQRKRVPNDVRHILCSPRHYCTTAAIGRLRPYGSPSATPIHSSTDTTHQRSTHILDSRDSRGPRDRRWNPTPTWHSAWIETAHSPELQTIPTTIEAKQRCDQDLGYIHHAHHRTYGQPNHPPTRHVDGSYSTQMAGYRHARSHCNTRWH